MTFEYIWVIFWGVLGLASLGVLIPVWGMKSGNEPSGWSIFLRVVTTIGFLIAALICFAVMNFSPCGPGILERVIQDIKSRY